LQYESVASHPVSPPPPAAAGVDVAAAKSVVGRKSVFIDLVGFLVAGVVVSLGDLGGVYEDLRVGRVIGFIRAGGVGLRGTLKAAKIGET
jgi:hypothetical protein